MVVLLVGPCWCSNSQDNIQTQILIYILVHNEWQFSPVKYDGGTLTFNPSTETLACTNITGTASTAQYADLAESTLQMMTTNWNSSYLVGSKK